MPCIKLFGTKYTLNKVYYIQYKVYSIKCISKSILSNDTLYANTDRYITKQASYNYHDSNYQFLLKSPFSYRLDQKKISKNMFTNKNDLLRDLCALPTESNEFKRCTQCVLHTGNLFINLSLCLIICQTCFKLTFDFKK